MFVVLSVFISTFEFSVNKSSFIFFLSSGVMCIRFRISSELVLPH